MRVLITGGAGFIGSHLAEALLAGGREVFVIDNLSTGSIDNIAHLKGHARFHYKSTDVPFREDADLVLGPTTKQRWAYACSKAIDEFLRR